MFMKTIKLSYDAFDPVSPGCLFYPVNTDAEPVCFCVVGDVNKAEVIPANTFPLSINSLILCGLGE